MGRPKKETDTIATIKIENAFWELLETIDYSKITIQKLADKAGVNRNAIYYHYENVDDVAQKAFSNLIKDDVVEEFVHMLLAYAKIGQEINRDEVYIKSMRKLQVCAGSKAVFINQMLKNEMKNIWFQVANIDESTLGEMDKLSIEFALCGIIALLGSSEVKENSLLMLQFPKTDIGIATLGTLLRLAEKSKEIKYDKQKNCF